METWPSRRSRLLAVPVRIISTLVFGLGHGGKPDFGLEALLGTTLAGLVFAWGLLWLPLTFLFGFD